MNDLLERSLLLPCRCALLVIASLWPLAVAAQDQSARFELALDITWSAATAPYAFPEGPHLSRLLLATHHSRYTLFRDGETASSGLELVAENGRVSVLRAELAEAQRRGRVGNVVEGPALPRAPGTLATTFEATTDHPLVSFVTMLAPSPDWFTGAADLRLHDGSAWVDALGVTLWTWDAGTDDGTDYVAANADTQPQQSIRLLATPHFLTDRGIVPVGTATLRRLD